MVVMMEAWTMMMMMMTRAAREGLAKMSPAVDLLISGAWGRLVVGHKTAWLVCEVLGGASSTILALQKIVWVCGIEKAVRSFITMNGR